MIGDLFDSPWKILIVAVVLIVLFGSAKLPHAARSLGQSMRILKREVQGLHEDEPAAVTARRSGPSSPDDPGGRRLRREALMAKRPSALAGARIVSEHLVRSQRQDNPEGRMPLMDHIRELRNRVVKMLLAVGAGMVVGFIFFNPVWAVIERPLCHAVIRGQTGCRTLGVNMPSLDGPLDPFYLRVKVAVIVAVVLSSPVWLYQVWAFIAPGLYAREKRWGFIFLGAAVPLFLAGVSLAYWSLGRSMHYLLGLTPSGVANILQVDQYMSFVMAMVLAFGIAFEVPLLIIMLNLAGILTHERFRKWRRVLIFAVFVVAGMANPSPDPTTMLILGGACVALVEVAEFIVWTNDRRRARAHPDPYAGLADNELSPLPLEDAGTRLT